MRLAEALILRADAQKRLMQLKQRLLSNALVQQGDEPAENPAELIEQLEELTAELTSLIQRINRTNVATTLEDGGSVADALAERDVLQLKHRIYRELAQAATITQQRQTRSEVKFVSTIDVAATQKTADRLAKEHRELDALIQEINWSTELVD